MNFFFLFLLIASPCLAIEELVPENLVDGTVEVTTRDGVKHKNSANEWKMVNREKSRQMHDEYNSILMELKQELMDAEDKRAYQVEQAMKNGGPRHTLSLMLGIGPLGYTTLQKDDQLDVFCYRGLVLGANYNYRVEGTPISVSLSGIGGGAGGNTGLAGFGYSW